MRCAIKYYGMLMVFLLAQLCFWNVTHAIRPQLGIVPDVPGKAALRALSFGDGQFIFRALALNIQNAGDSYGRFTALKLYDYKKLRDWLFLLDTLDDRSNFVPSMATYYYGQTQRVSDVRYIVDYLYAHSKDRVQLKWWWLVQAIYLADSKLKDKDLALKVAEPLVGAENIPIWARQMPAFVHEKRGEGQQALAIMQGIISGAEKNEISKTELNFMEYFMKERLKQEGMLKGTR